MDTRLAIFGVVIGIMVFAGLLSLHATLLIPAPCTSPYACATPTPETIAYNGLVRPLLLIAVTVLDLAVGLSVALAFLLAARPNVPEDTRRSVFLFSTLFLAAWTVAGTLLGTFLFSFLRFL